MSSADRREGVFPEKAAFRVYVRTDILDLPDDYTATLLDEKIKGEAEKRFIEISRAYVFSAGEDAASDMEILFLKKEKKPEIVWRRVSDGYAEAFVDYYIGSRLAQMISSLEKKTEAELKKNE
ncbi:MAG: hypothetical protein ACRCUT_14245 [Spirochaetota bacterium]